MGGTVAITLRTARGKEYRVSDWTNATPWMFNNPPFFENDRGHVTTLTRRFGKTLRTPRRDLSYTDLGRHLAPRSYGLIVADLKAKTLLDCQGYTSFFQMYSVHLWDEDPARPLPGGPLERLLGFVRRGWVAGVDRYDPGAGGWGEDGSGAWTEKRIRVELAGRRAREAGDFRFRFEPPGWTYTRYPEDADGFTRMRADVKALGFELTRYENALWHKYILGRRQQDE